MKLAVLGTRTFNKLEMVDLITALWPLVKLKWPEVDMIVSGGADGVDAAAEHAAANLTGRYALVIKAEWDKHGKAAGPLRNEKVAEIADCLLLIWNGRSPGSTDVLRRFKRWKKPVMEIEIS
jgi:hypothetical protein